MWDSAVPSPSAWYAPQNLEHIVDLLSLKEEDKFLPAGIKA